MKFYKAVWRLANGVRISAGMIPDNLRLQYSKDVFTRSPFDGGKIFVFGQKNIAIFFIQGNEYKGKRHKKCAVAEVWSVKVVNPVMLEKRIPSVWIEGSAYGRKACEIVSNYWRGKAINSELLGNSYQHTYLADMIKLVERVK